MDLISVETSCKGELWTRGQMRPFQALVAEGASLLANDFVLFTALHCATYFANEQVCEERRLSSYRGPVMVWLLRWCAVF